MATGVREGSTGVEATVDESQYVDRPVAQATARAFDGPQGRAVPTRHRVNVVVLSGLREPAADVQVGPFDSHRRDRTVELDVVGQGLPVFAIPARDSPSTEDVVDVDEVAADV